MEISLERFGRRLPVRSRKGTPYQRQLSMKIRSATYVSVRDLGSTPGSVVYPAYCARTTLPATALRGSRLLPVRR